jgi:uncharacterized membrane protein
MTRQQIKLKAKEDIRGRVFVCFLPFLILLGIQILIDLLLGERTYGIIPILINIAMFPLTVGIAKIYLKIVDSKQSDVLAKEVFSFYQAKRLGQLFLAYIVSTAFMILGFICLIIPGIILALRYSMLPFIMADYEDITWRDALKKCKEITDGRKGEIFGYWLSFLGWFILIVITVGIMSIYVLPYFQATMANLYNEYNPRVQVVESQTLQF